MGQEPERTVVDAEKAYEAERLKTFALAQRLIETEQERDHLARLLSCVAAHYSRGGELRVPASVWFATSQMDQRFSELENPLSGEKVIQVINVPAHEAEPG